MKIKYKLLFFDFETSYHDTIVWGPGKTYISEKSFLDEAKIIMVGYRWATLKWCTRQNIADSLTLDKKVHCLDWGLKKQCDKQLLKKFSKEVAKADWILGHNSQAFDIPWFVRRLAKHQLPYVAAIKSVDTLKLSRPFKFVSNSLDYLCKYFGLQRKMGLPISTWIGVKRYKNKYCMDKLRQRCKSDVTLLIEVFKKLAPYVKLDLHPVMAGKERDCCPECGGNRRVKNGYYSTMKGIVHRIWKCKCGHRYKDIERVN